MLQSHSQRYWDPLTGTPNHAGDNTLDDTHPFFMHPFSQGTLVKSNCTHLEGYSSKEIVFQGEGPANSWCSINAEIGKLSGNSGQGQPGRSQELQRLWVAWSPVISKPPPCVHIPVLNREPAFNSSLPRLSAQIVAIRLLSTHDLFPFQEAFLSTVPTMISPQQKRVREPGGKEVKPIWSQHRHPKKPFGHERNSRLSPKDFSKGHTGNGEREDPGIAP
jgi:hypothetical protein